MSVKNKAMDRFAIVYYNKDMEKSISLLYFFRDYMLYIQKHFNKVDGGEKE